MEVSCLVQVEPGLFVNYVSGFSGGIERYARHRPLGVVAFGSLQGQADFRLNGTLTPAAGEGALEIWQAADEVEDFHTGMVIGARSANYAFGAIEILEDPALSLEASMEYAYRELLLFFEQAGLPQPIRFWNYLSGITDDQDGMERYRLFNIGRQRAFQALLRQDVPPVASCLGCKGERSVIYALAAKEPALAIENPRQVSAYAYPACYGPVSPSFSRASRHLLNGLDTLFISGTASIVGHETRHVADFDAQMDETLKNLRLMMELTGQGAESNGQWAVKTYLRDPGKMDKLDAALAAFLPEGSQRLHLLADICRKELLLEIEAVRCAI
jgi:chorismate lyase / 3-hydroxybenzoate synthase